MNLSLRAAAGELAGARRPAGRPWRAGLRRGARRARPAARSSDSRRSRRPSRYPAHPAPLRRNPVAHSKIPLRNVKIGDGRSGLPPHTYAQRPYSSKSCGGQNGRPPPCLASARWLSPDPINRLGAPARRRMSQVIALVDDDRNILTSVSIALQAEGFVTRVYSDPAVALKAISDNPPDLGVFDIKMPRNGRNGAASPGARIQRDPGDLPDLQGRRTRRSARPRDGRRRLYLQALLAAAADRAHPRTPAPAGAGARAKPRQRARSRSRHCSSAAAWSWTRPGTRCAGTART